MSARSPRGSLSGASSAEVAEDFRGALKDLQINNRYEIMNLTTIARENTEYAQAISDALEGHIRTVCSIWSRDDFTSLGNSRLKKHAHTSLSQTAPPRKLPALYVLDSIVKNVGTPYTLYLGKNLFQTFMDAYTLVDGNTRRAMEGMLKTWKEPVPAALSSAPVFPPDIVRPIENALIKYRTVMVQNSRPAHDFHTQPAYRSTPTPPQAYPRFPPSLGPTQNQPQTSTIPTPPPNLTVFSAPHSQQMHGYAQQVYPPQTQTPQLPSFYTPPQPPSVVPNNAAIQELLKNLLATSAPSSTPNVVAYQPPNGPTLLPPSATPAALPQPYPPQSQTPQPNNAAIQQVLEILPFMKSTVPAPKLSLAPGNLKTFRPELVHKLYGARPHQCPNCGRRFSSREDKALHLDWHFRTNQRIATNNRPINRNWFPQEAEWVHLDDFDPSVATADKAASAQPKQEKRPEDQYVVARPGETRALCSIDAGEIKTTWSEELQEWIFKNAVRLGDRIVHATCLAEFQKGAGAGLSAGQQRARSSTPDSTLGKRKADGGLAGKSARVRT
jgi:pre-mRNA cleavage complex 2 protein Pcf11